MALSSGLAARPANLMLFPPNSEKWLMYTPEFIYEHHTGELRGDVLLYVAQVFDNKELKDHTDRFRKVAVRANTFAHVLTDVHDKICIEHGVNHNQARVTYDKNRYANIHKREPKAGHSTKVLKEKELSDNPTLAELAQYGQQNAPDAWYLKAAKVFDERDFYDIKEAFGHKGKCDTPTVALKREVRRKASAIESAREDVTPGQKIEVADDGVQSIEDVKKKMHGLYPPKPEPPKVLDENGKGVRGLQRTDYLVAQDYAVFKDRYKELREHVTASLSSPIPAAPMFSSGFDIIHFFAREDAGIRDGETEESIRKFTDVCYNTTIFDYKPSDNGVLDRWMLCIMHQWGMSGPQGRVRKAFLTNVAVCISHLEGLLAVQGDGNGPISLEGWNDAGVDCVGKKKAKSAGPVHKRKRHAQEEVQQPAAPTALDIFSKMENPPGLVASNTAPPDQNSSQGSSKVASKRRGITKRKAIDQHADLTSSPKRSRPAVGPLVPPMSSEVPTDRPANYQTAPNGPRQLPQPAYTPLPSARVLETTQRAFVRAESVDEFITARRPVLSSVGPTLALPEPAPVQAPATLQTGGTAGSSSSSRFDTGMPPPPSRETAPSLSSAMLPAPAPLQLGDPVGKSSSSTGSIPPRSKTFTRKDKRKVATAPAQPLHKPAGMLGGDDRERAAIVALSHIMISLGPDKPAILTSPAALLTTFDPGHDKFEGLGETATTTADFRNFCNTTTIFNGHTGGKNVDDFVAWVLEEFVYGSRLSGTFLNFLMNNLAQMKSIIARRDVEERVRQEEYERESQELLEGDLRFTMEDTHPFVGKSVIGARGKV